MKMLFYICDGCKSPNFIFPEIETSLKHIHTIVCGACNHEHSDLKDLKNYSKATGDIYE